MEVDEADGAAATVTIPGSPNNRAKKKKRVKKNSAEGSASASVLRTGKFSAAGIGHVSPSGEVFHKYEHEKVVYEACIELKGQPDEKYAVFHDAIKTLV